MNYSYIISGTCNAYPIKSKYFKNSAKALKYLDKLLVNYNLQVEDIYNIDDITTTYVANNYTRFSITKIA